MAERDLNLRVLGPLSASMCTSGHIIPWPGPLMFSFTEMQELGSYWRVGLSCKPTSLNREALGKFLRLHLGSAGHQDVLMMSAIGRTGEGGDNSRSMYFPSLNEQFLDEIP